MSLVLLFVFALAAAFVQRVSGFGFGIVIMTVLPYLLPTYGEATTLSGLLAMVTSAIIVARMWRHLVWRKLLPILATFLVVSWFAVQFVALSGSGLLKRILGVVLILASVYFYCLSSRVKVRPTLPVQLSMGTLSGFMGGLFGMQGPPAVLYFIATAERKEEYVALAQTYFLVGNAVMTAYRAAHGFLTYEVAEAWGSGVLAVLLGTWIGGRVFRFISIDMLRRIVYIFMGVSGVVALLV